MLAAQLLLQRAWGPLRVRATPAERVNGAKAATAAGRQRRRVMSLRGESEEERAARKAAKKAGKATRRAQRSGELAAADPDFGRKPCELCTSPRDLLIRCQTDHSGAWRMLCGSCWRQASGGVPDGTPEQQAAGYRYGGLWKNLHRQ